MPNTAPRLQRLGTRCCSRQSQEIILKELFKNFMFNKLIVIKTIMSRNKDSLYYCAETKETTSFVLSKDDGLYFLVNLKTSSSARFSPGFWWHDTKYFPAPTPLARSSPGSEPSVPAPPAPIPPPRFILCNICRIIRLHDWSTPQGADPPLFPLHVGTAEK